MSDDKDHSDYDAYVCPRGHVLKYELPVDVDCPLCALMEIDREFGKGNTRKKRLGLPKTLKSK